MTESKIEQPDNITSEEDKEAADSQESKSNSNRTLLKQKTSSSHDANSLTLSDA